MALGQTAWKGTVNTAWTNAANWTAGVPTAAMDAILGDTNFTGSYQPTVNGNGVCKSLVVGGARATTLTINRALTVQGDVLIATNGVINHSAAVTISVGGNWTNRGSYTTARTGCTIAFAGSTQYLSGATAFRRLTINAGSTTFLATNITVTNALTVNGTLDPGDAPTWTIAGPGTLTVGNGGRLRVKAATFAGNYALTGTITLNSGSTVDYAANTNQTIANTLTYRTLQISGGGVKSLAGNLPNLNAASATEGNVYVDAGTLDLGTFTANRATTTAGGTFAVASGAVLRIGGTNSFPANYATYSLNPNSSVEYSGTNQTVAARTYGHLILSSSGTATKTLPTSAFTVLGNFLMRTNAPGAAVTANANAGLSVAGHLTLGPGTTFNAGSAPLTFAGNWTNQGNFQGGSSTVTFAGTDSTLAGGGVTSFHHLTVSNGNVVVLPDTSLTVSGNLVSSETASFQHLPGAGSVTLTGAGRLLQGNGFSFNNLVVSGSVTASGSFTVAGHLRVDGSLVASGGTLTLSGNAKSIFGSGTLALHALNVPGTITTTNNFSLSGDLSVGGSFTATAGTVTFTGITRLSGTASLFNGTLNGTLLQMTPGSVFRMYGAATLLAGTFDAQSMTPNTVVYCSAAPQTIVPVTYHNLEIAPGGPRLLIGPVTVTGDLTVQSGALLQGGTNAHTLVLHGDWRNEGTFQAGNSTVELAGARSALLSGTNTFHQLRVNKADAGLAVRLAHPQTVATLEMLRGWMDTLTNTLTLTSNRTGDGVIWGTITRAHAFTAGTPYAFESPYTSVRFDTPGGITAVTVRATRQPPADFPFAASINREYEIHLTGTGPYSATLRLHYQPEDLNGNDESALRLWRNASGTWLPSGRTAGDTLARWVEQSGVTNLLGRWTLSDDNNAVAWNGQLSSAWEHPDNWTVLQGSPSRPPSTNDIVQLGGFAFGHQPVISTPVAVGSLSFGSAQPVTLTLNPGGSLTTLGNLGGVWTNPAAHTLAIGAQSLTVGGNLILSDGTPGHSIHLTASTGNVSVAGSLTTAGDASISFSGPGTLRIGGDFNHLGGTFSPGTSTVLYDGATDQNVAGLGYHRLGFEKDGGTARLDSSATVAGELHLARGGTFLLNAPLTVAGNVHIGSGTTLSAIGGPMHVAGSWTNEGVFLPGNGTVIFNGPADQTIQASTFHHLIVNKTSGIARLAGNLAINGDLTVSAGTLDLGGFSADRTSLGGTLNLAGGTLLRVGAAFPARFAVLNLAPTSTVRYEGAGPQTLRALSYGHLVLANGGGNPKALEGSTVVTGDLILQSNATLSAGPYLLELRGNWTNRGVFQPGTGLLKLGGTAKFFSGSTELQHLSVTGSYTVDGADLTIRGDLTVAGNLDAGSGQMSLDGNLQVSGVLSSRGNLSFTGSRVQTIQLPGTLLLSSNSLVSFNGTVAPAMAFSGGLNFGAVQINNTAGIAPAGDWTVHGTFTVASNAAFHGGAGTHLFRAAFLNHGTVTSSGTLGFEPAADAVIQLAGVTFQSSGLVRFAGSTAITLTGNPAAFKDVVIANTHPTGVTPATNWTVAGNLTLQPATTLRAGSGTHSLAGDLRVDGRLDGQTSSILLSGNSQVGGLGSTEFHHLTVLGVVSLLSDCSVSGNFTNHGSFDGSDFAVAFVGTNNAVLAGTNAPALDLVLVQKNSAALALARNLTVGSALTLAGGTLDTGPFVLAQETAGGTLSVGAGATLKLGGTNSMPVFDVITLDPASTVEYAGSGSQLIAALNYGNLASSSTGARTLASTGTIGIAGTFTPGPNSYTVTGSTVLFNGAGAQTIPAFNYFNLASSSTGARTLAPAGTIGVAGTFTPGPNSYTVTGSTVLFNGAGAQTIPAFTYGHLAIGGSGTKTLAGPATVRGNFSLLTGVFHDGGHPLVVQGHLTTAATHTGTGRIVLSGGATNHLLSATVPLQNLELADTNGAVLIQTNLLINGTLTLTTGILAAGTNEVILATGANLLRTNGWVHGNLRKPVPLGAPTVTFEIGDATNYAPVSLAFTNVTTAGTVLARTFGQDHPDISASGISPLRSANRFWTLTHSGVAFARCAATFQFHAADLDPDTSPLDFIIAQKTGAGWSLPTLGVKTVTNIQAVGLVAFGDFQVGASAAIPQITAQPQSRRVNLGDSVTFSVTASGAAPLAFQWRKNGSEIPGATNAVYHIPAVTDAHAGLYSCLVSNANGVALSTNALLTVNHAPSLASFPDQVIPELSTATWSLTASDPDGDELTWTLLEAPPGAVLLGPGLIAWTPTESQGPSTNLFLVEVSDTGSPPLRAQRAFEVRVTEVNAAPSVTCPGLQTVAELTPLSVAAVATDPDLPANTLTFSLVSAPAGMTIHPTSGLITWTPSEAQGPGTNLVVVRVTDDGWPRLSNVCSFTVRVEEVNTPPVLTVPPDQTLTPLVTWRQTNRVADADLPSNTLTFSLVAGPPGMSLDPQTGVLTWTPDTEFAPSTNTVIVRVTDDNPWAMNERSLSDQKSFTLIVSALQDTNRPVVMMLTPAAGTRTADAAVLIQGIARDNTRVERVLYRIQRLFESAGWESEDFREAGGTTNWSALAGLAPGTNLITIKAVDAAGNESVPLVRSVFRIVNAPITVQINGSGWVTPEVNGQLLELGRVFHLTAQPRPQNLFSHWVCTVEGRTERISTNPTLSFLMRSNLTLTANFMTNRFIGAAGTYHGLVWSTNGPTVGLFMLKTDRKQKFSGRLYFDGGIYPFAGAFDLNGFGRTIRPVLRPGRPPLTIQVQLDLARGRTNAITLLEGDSWIASGYGDRHVFSITERIATEYLGAYTFVLPGSPGSTTLPAGDSVATVTVASNGWITAAGHLAEAASASVPLALKPVAVPVSAEGYWPFYAALYPKAVVYEIGATNLIRREKAGYIAGWLNFSPAPARDLNGSLLWIKPAWTNAFHPAGFTNFVAILGSAYVPPSPGARALDLASGMVVTADGNLTTPFTNRFTLGTNNLLTILPPNLHTQRLGLELRTGLLKGQFQHPQNGNLPALTWGVLLQDQTLARGFFLGTNQSGTLLLRAE